MLHLKKAVILLFFLAFISHAANAQLIAYGANYKERSNYQIDGGRDTLYFFNPVNNVFDIEIGADTLAYDTYLWSVYSSTGGAYVTIDALSDTSKSIILDTIADIIGIRLIASNADSADTARCWIFKNLYDIAITNKNDTNYVQGYSCNQFAINVLELNKQLEYYNPATNVRNIHFWKVNANWTTNHPEAVKPTKTAGQIIMSDFYWKDTEYTITAIDSAGKVSEDFVWVPAIKPKAEVNAELIPITDQKYYPGRGDWYYEENSRYAGDVSTAPVKIKISSSSLNSSTYNFLIYNDTDGTESFSEGDSVIYNWAVGDDSVDYILPYPGLYGVRLTAVKYNVLNGRDTTTCKDVASRNDIEIEEANLSVESAIPNVITVPKHTFYFDDASITNFEIQIFNRYGKRVHRFQGNIRDWPGWDGRINESNRYVHTGVYFYVVKKLGVLTDFSSYLPDNEYDFNEFKDEFYKMFEGNSGASDGGSGSGTGGGQSSGGGNFKQFGYDKDKKPFTFSGCLHVYNLND